MIDADDRHWLTLGQPGSIILCAQCDGDGHELTVREDYVGCNVLHGIGRCTNCGSDIVLWEREAVVIG